MPTQILPAASLRGANRLPAGRTPTGRSNHLIWTGLLAIGRAIFRAALHFLPAGREFPPPRPSGDGGVADPPWMKRPIPQMLSLRAKRSNLGPLSTLPVEIASSPTAPRNDPSDPGQFLVSAGVSAQSPLATRSSADTGNSKRSPRNSRVEKKRTARSSISPVPGFSRPRVPRTLVRDRARTCRYARCPRHDRT